MWEGYGGGVWRQMWEGYVGGVCGREEYGGGVWGRVCGREEYGGGVWGRGMWEGGVWRRGMGEGYGGGVWKMGEGYGDRWGRGMEETCRSDDGTHIEKGTVESEKGTTEVPEWEQGDPTAEIPEVPRPVVGDAAPGPLSNSVDKGSSAVAAAVPGSAAVPGLSDPQASDTGSAGKPTSTTLPLSQDTTATHPPTHGPDRQLCDGQTRSTIITRYGRTIKKPARYSDPDV